MYTDINIYTPYLLYRHSSTTVLFLVVFHICRGHNACAAFCHFGVETSFLSEKAGTSPYLSLSVCLACFHAPSFILFLTLSFLSLYLSHTPTLTCAYITTLSCTNAAEESSGEWWWLVMGMCFSLNLIRSHPSCPKTCQGGPSCYHGRTCTALSAGQGVKCSSFLCFKTKLNVMSFLLWADLLHLEPKSKNFYQL